MRVLRVMTKEKVLRVRGRYHGVNARFIASLIGMSQGHIRQLLHKYPPETPKDLGDFIVKYKMRKEAMDLYESLNIF